MISVQLHAQDPEVERAWSLAASGHRSEAILILQGRISQSPKDADARLLLGSLFAESGQYDQAIPQLTEAVHLVPRSADAQLALGEAYLNAGNLLAARHPLEEAIALAPESGVALLDLARVLLEDGKFNDAAPLLDHALHVLKPDSDAANAHYLRAKIYTAQSDIPQAVHQLEQSVAILPQFPEAWSDLGQARQALVDHRGALQALRRAVELAPDDSVAQTRLGEEYLRQHEPNLAVAPLSQAERLNPQDQTILNALQLALRQQGKIDQADAVKQRLSAILRQRDAAAQDNLTAIQLNNQGADLQKKGQLADAVSKYAAAVKLSPQNITMRVNYAISLLRLGQWTDGLNQLHEAQKLDPTNPKIKSALQDALAQASANSAPQGKDKTR